MFSYPDGVENNTFMWCCRVVEIFNTRNDKVIKLDIKCYEQFFACGESEKKEEILKKNCGILHHQGKGREGRTCENT